MQFSDILKRVKGQTVIINNSEERVLLEVDEDFIVLQGGNPQMRLTEFIPMQHIVKVIRADYPATGDSSTSLDLTGTTGDQRRAAAH